MANPSNRPKVPRDGSFLFFDQGGPTGPNTFGGPTATYCGARVREGTFNAGAKEEQIVIRTRGKVCGVRKGDDPVYEITFDTPLYQFTNGTNDVLLDVLDGTGAIDGVWTAEDDTIEHWNIGVQFSAEGTDQGDDADHTCTFYGCVAEWTVTENENAETIVSITIQSYDFDSFTKGGPA